MKKFTGNFTTDASKALKNSERLVCCTDEDGMIYVTNGMIAYRMNPPEYSAIVQPVTCCEAGNWSMRNGEKTGEQPFDLVKTFRDAVKETETAPALERCPLTLATQKKGVTAATYYNAAQDFTALYNTLYVSALYPGFTLRSSKAYGPAVAYRDNEPFALVLPIKSDDNTNRAVKAYFTQGSSADEADRLRAELAALQDKLNTAEIRAAALLERVGRQADEADRFNAKISTLEAALSDLEHNNAELQDQLTVARQAAQHANEAAAAAIADAAAQAPAAVPTPEPRTAAELIASRFHELPGVTVTIKGAQTTSPVVWLTGDTDPHAEQIKAAGGKWSNKRSAYYVRVA